MNPNDTIENAENLITWSLEAGVDAAFNSGISADNVRIALRSVFRKIYERPEKFGAPKLKVLYGSEMQLTFTWEAA